MATSSPALSIFSSFSRRIISPLLDFIYPPVCLSCNALPPNGFQRVCDTCWNSIERIDRNHPLYLETKAKLTETGVVDDLVSCFVFEKEGAFQHIAHALKYEGMKLLGTDLGRRTGNVLKEWQVSADVVIPVPLHRKKFRERGYNQAERIARGLAEVSGIPVRTDIVRRGKETRTQTQLNLEERKKNVEGAFELASSSSLSLRDTTCVIVDDVITTGATIVSCASVLKRAGVARVIAASAALAR